MLKTSKMIPIQTMLLTEEDLEFIKGRQLRRIKYLKDCGVTKAELKAKDPEIFPESFIDEHYDTL